MRPAPLRRLPAVVLCLSVAACSSLRYGGPAQSPGVNWDADSDQSPRVAPDGKTPHGKASRPTATSNRASRDTAASGPGRAQQRDNRGTLPDPRPLAMRRQWQYTLLWDRGTVRVESVVERRFERPRETARQMGRFAIELWRGHELIDRVRFDFPLLAAEPVVKPGPKRLDAPPSFAAGSKLKRVVLVPASPRAARAVLVDRATGSRLDLSWPPDTPPDAKSGPVPPIVPVGAAD